MESGPTRNIKALTQTWAIVAGLSLAIILVTAFAPLERTLGARARLVYLHGAWVWAALFFFLLSGILGLAGITARSFRLQSWSKGLGRTALLLWLSFLPMSLYVMQANWNGLFLAEPRFRISLNLALAALLLQIGLTFIPLYWAALVNGLFAGVMFVTVSGFQNVMHPDSPVLRSDSSNIKFFFFLLLALVLLDAGVITAGLRRFREGAGQERTSKRIE